MKFKYFGKEFNESHGILRKGVSPLMPGSGLVDQAPTKSKCWFRYVNDTFVIWPHGRGRLQEFLGHLNSINPRIQFTMEVEEDGKLPIMDVQPTYTDRYLNKDFNHHRRQKRGIIKTLVERVRRICDPKDIEKELKHFVEAFAANVSSQEIKRAIRPDTEEETATRRMQNSRIWILQKILDIFRVLCPIPIFNSFGDIDVVLLIENISLTTYQKVSNM
ncbi:hypothetical protein NQ315_016187 [Exocentrus adspersus]|uniref:Helix-turn-helix domain-containing protein n=1 Tax=Exocentrus adspersus TaxID=1586481 RepID=A0AAV8V7S0_9CUCU|nr:hypothetical protein NQ315_016187 [Exocentrus adspersus]